MALYLGKNPGKASAYAKSYRMRHGKRALRMKRENAMRNKYGENHELIRSGLMSEQHGLCAICDSPPFGKHGKLCMDHCHVSGIVAGLLCVQCNSAIGLLLEDPNIIRRAAEYVEGRKF
jgi:hypothetical protein